jgi:tetraacyldisaccharide 4'-kinase
MNCQRALLPIAVLYGWGVRLRNKLFDKGILSSESFPLPVICIGNLAVGGTGKTPHTEYLIRLLTEAQLHTAVLSRGYKRKSKGYLLATAATKVEEIGDEPYQMKEKYPHVRVAVDERRPHGIRKLLALTQPAVEVVLLDDALQHRYVKAGLTILLTDYHRLYCDDRLLPLGRLREPSSGAQRADLIVVTKCPLDLTETEETRIARKLHLTEGQQLFFSGLKYGKLTPLFGGTERPLSSLTEADHVLLVTGIASPQPLCEELLKHTPHVETLTFPDHHAFSAKELEQLHQTFEQKHSTLLITTEKDATRLQAHPDLNESLKQYIYKLPIEVVFLQSQQEQFNKTILQYVREDTRDRRLPEE